MITLYSQQDSGNCYKVRLLLAHLAIPFRTIEVNANSGETRTPEMLALNPIGKVPFVILDEGPDDRRPLAESNAILLYFADGTRFVPADRYERAKVHEWLFFEQYSHEPAVAVRRSLSIYPELKAFATPERMADLMRRGERALDVLEARLKGADWLVGTRPTVADLSLYAYSHVAGEGGFDLSGRPGICRWLDRVAALPGHVEMMGGQAPLAA